MAHLSGLVVLFCFQRTLGTPYPLKRRSACHDCFAILTFTEKEGFEPSRRFSRPTPFPGEPLRPTWVLLHGRINNGSTVPTNAAFRLKGRSAIRNPTTSDGASRCSKDSVCYRRHLATSSGEDGIRTHVPVKANGFQDRLVMTTSIPLHSM